MKMTLSGHFIEFRQRLIRSFLFFALSIAVGFYFVDSIESFIIKPVADTKMIYTALGDGLMIQFSVAGLFALFVSIPFFLYQIWAYIKPALKKNEKKIILSFLFAAPILFILGVSFAYYVLIPMLTKFFMSVGTDIAVYMPNVRSYLDLSIGIMKSFGVAFEFPLILIMLNRAGLLSKKQILSGARYIIVLIFIIAAMMTPPDVVSQIALALPLLVLFGLSFLFMI